MQEKRVRGRIQVSRTQDDVNRYQEIVGKRGGMGGGKGNNSSPDATWPAAGLARRAACAFSSRVSGSDVYVRSMSLSLSLFSF